jgi:hypothetical protein
MSLFTIKPKSPYEIKRHLEAGRMGETPRSFGPTGREYSPIELPADLDPAQKGIIAVRGAFILDKYVIGSKGRVPENRLGHTLLSFVGEEGDVRSSVRLPFSTADNVLERFANVNGKFFGAVSLPVKADIIEPSTNVWVHDEVLRSELFEAHKDDYEGFFKDLAARAIFSTVTGMTPQETRLLTSEQLQTA